MRVVFNIEVGVDVPSYVQVGELLDKITRDLNSTIGSNGEFDLRNFQAAHTPIRKHPEGEFNMMTPMEARSMD